MASLRVPVRFSVASHHCTHLLCVREDEGDNPVWLYGWNIVVCTDCRNDCHRHNQNPCWILFRWRPLDLFRHCYSYHRPKSWLVDSIAIPSFNIYTADKRTKRYHRPKRNRLEWMQFPIRVVLTDKPEHRT